MNKQNKAPFEPATHWLLAVSRENFDISFQEKLQGFTKENADKADQIKSGDKLAFYLFDEKVFTGTATVGSECFTDDKPLWKSKNPDELFSRRLRIRITAHPSVPMDARETAFLLDYVKKWPPEIWPMAFHSMLQVISRRDFDYLNTELKRSSTRPARR